MTVLTPQQALQDCIAKVQMLVPPLNQGQANSLITKLNQAISSLDQGKTGTACNQLQAFINQASGFTNGGILTPAQGQMLIECVNEVRSALGCGS